MLFYIITYFYERVQKQTYTHTEFARHIKKHERGVGGQQHVFHASKLSRNTHDVQTLFIC